MRKTFFKVAFKIIGDRIVMMDLSTGNYYSLNNTAYHIIQLLQKGKKQEEIIKSLQSSFSITPLKAKRDVQKLMLQLRKARLLTAKSR